jgi:hypothetical protein
VKDASGAVMPGVTAEATSPALIEKVRAAVTDAQGQYKIVELPPGVYTVSFSLAGFASLRREGVELTANFTAAVNVEMHAGQLEEMVTVAGATPLVDVQNVVQQAVLSRALLDTVPTNKSLLGFAAFVPAIIVPITAQDVGGSKDERSGAVVTRSQSGERLGKHLPHPARDGVRPQDQSARPSTDASVQVERDAVACDR